MLPSIRRIEVGGDDTRRPSSPSLVTGIHHRPLSRIAHLAVDQEDDGRAGPPEDRVIIDETGVTRF